MGHLLAHGFFEGDVRWIDAFHLSKACIQKFFVIADPACYQADGCLSCLFQDTHRQFAHQRLTVGRAFASDDEVCICDKFFV